MSRVKKAAASATKEKSQLDEVMGEIRKNYGAGVLSRGKDIHQPLRIPTDIFTLDLALLGGIPFNRITQFEGHKHAGKTSVAMRILGNAQRLYPEQEAVLLDVEGTYDAVWGEKQGLDSERLIVVQPETGESAMDIMDALIRTKEVSMIVVDSIAALTPMKELDRSAEDGNRVGGQALMIGAAVRKAVSGLIAERHREHYVTLLMINQYRSKIGGFSPNPDPVQVAGGKALGFANTLEIAFKNKEKMGKDARDIEAIEENEHAFTIKKNKVNGGIRTGEFRMRRVPDESLGLAEGDIDEAGTMLVYAKKFGIYTGGGSSWKLEFWEDSHTFRGATDACIHIYADQELKWRLRNFLIHEQARHMGMPQYMLDRFLPESLRA